jgi:hypothetical protein
LVEVRRASLRTGEAGSFGVTPEWIDVEEVYNHLGKEETCLQ